MTDFAKKYPWWPDACRLKVGLLERPQPQVPHVKAGSPEQAELDRFEAWVLWNHAGRPAPRPTTFWTRVPSPVYKTILTEFERKHPKPKPNGGAQPKSERPLDVIWTRPTFCSTWGEKTGQWTPNELAALCQRIGVALCMELIPDNDEFVAATREACANHGVPFGGWTNVPQAAIGEQGLEDMLARWRQARPEFLCANVEERWQLGDTKSAEDPSNGCHRRFCEAFRAYPGLGGVPWVVQTNLGGHEARDKTGKVIGYDQEVAAIYEAHGARCQIEAYTNEQPNVAIDGYEFSARQAGYTPPYSMMIGIYETAHGKFPVSSYKAAFQKVGRTHYEWAYDLEQATDDDLAEITRTF